MQTIVVGADGSSGSKDALQFAATEARLRGAKLRVVTAWHVPPLGYGGALGPIVDPHEFERGAQAISKQAVDELGEADAALDVESVIPRATRRKRCSQRQRTPICSSSAHAATEGSSGFCSAR